MRRQKGKTSSQSNATTHLGTFEGVDQTAFANVGEADDAYGDALRGARFIRLEEAKQRGCRARGEVRALMRARRAERESWSGVTEMFQPCLGILARHQIYKHADARQPMSMTRGGKMAARGLMHIPILLSTNTRRLPSTSRLRTSSSTSRLRHPAGSRASSTRRTTSASSTTLCNTRM